MNALRAFRLALEAFAVGVSAGAFLAILYVWVMK